MFDRFRVAYESASLTRLKAPYTSNCRDYEKSGYNSDSDCFRQCIIRQCIKTFKKVPFSTILNEPYAYEHIRYVDLQNITMRKQLTALHSICAAECKQANCEEKYVLTRANRETGVGDLSFTVNAPKDLHIDIELHPKMIFQEYLIYIFSVFGTWFGLSIITLNPFKLLKRLQSNQRNNFQIDHRCRHCSTTRAMIKYHVKEELDHLIDKLLSIEYRTMRSNKLARIQF